MSGKFMTGAAVQPRQDMPEPYILWDTRSWDGSLGVGTGGIPNEGTAGPSFDLDVTERVLGDGSYAYFAKQGPAVEDASWVTTAVDWDAVGGVPCDGPVTVMMAFGDFPRRSTAGDPSGFPNASVYALQYFRSNPSDWHWTMGGEWYNNDDGDMSGYLDANANADACDYKFSTVYGDSNPGDDLAVREQLLVLTHDIADGGGTFWRWPEPCPAEIEFVPPTAPTLTPFTFEIFDEDAPCDGKAAFAPCASQAAQGSILGGTNEQFCFIGEHRSWAPLTPGQPWNGLIGVAMFRGEPTRAQVQFWHDYFLTGYTPTTTPLGFRPDNNWTIRVDDTYVYHYIRAGSGVPCVLSPIPGLPTPTTVDLFMIGGGGAGFDNDSTSGQPAGGGAAGQVRQASGLVVPPLTNITCYIGPAGARYTGSGRGAGQPGGPTIWDLGSNTPGGQLTAFGGNAGLGTGVGGANDSFAGGAAISPAGGGGAGSGGVGGSAPSSLEAGPGGPGVTNDWETGSPLVYGRGGNGGGRAAFGDPDLINPPVIPFRARSGNGGNAQLTPTQSDSAGQLGFLCIRYPRMD
jgi:hypothetical protein